MVQVSNDTFAFDIPGQQVLHFVKDFPIGASKDHLMYVGPVPGGWAALKKRAGPHRWKLAACAIGAFVGAGAAVGKTAGAAFDSESGGWEHAASVQRNMQRQCWEKLERRHRYRKCSEKCAKNVRLRVRDQRRLFFCAVPRVVLSSVA